MTVRWLPLTLLCLGACTGSGSTPDAGPMDAGPTDAGPEDAGPPDAGPVDAGRQLVPDPPSFASVELAGNSLQVSWGAPAYQGAGPLVGYLLAMNGTSSSRSLSVPSSARSYMLTPSLGVPLHVTVQAYNAYGLSAPTEAPGAYATGHFGATAWSVTLRSGPVDVAIGDINEDGRPDIVVNVNCTPTVFLGQEDGGFGPAVASLPGDLGSSRISVLQAGGQPWLHLRYGVVLGQPDGTFAEVSPFTEGASVVGAGDFFGTGTPWLVSVKTGVDGGEVVLELPDAGGFTQHASPLPLMRDDLSSATVGDFDGDGHVDLLLSFRSTGQLRLQLLRGDGQGHFEAQPVSGPMGDLPLSLERLNSVGDLAHDGRPSLLSSQGCTLIALEPDGGFSASSTGPNGCLSRGGSFLTDVDADGWDDLVSWDDHQMHIGLNDHTGHFHPPEVYVLLDPQIGQGPALQGLAIGDLNGDGKPDLVTVRLRSYSYSPDNELRVQFGQ